MYYTSMDNRYFQVFHVSEVLSVSVKKYLQKSYSRNRVKKPHGRSTAPWAAEKKKLVIPGNLPDVSGPLLNDLSHGPVFFSAEPSVHDGYQAFF